jgi:hypothetical protein
MRRLRVLGVCSSWRQETIGNSVAPLRFIELGRIVSDFLAGENQNRGSTRSENEINFLWPEGECFYPAVPKSVVAKGFNAPEQANGSFVQYPLPIQGIQNLS